MASGQYKGIKFSVEPATKEDLERLRKKRVEEANKEVREDNQETAARVVTEWVEASLNWMVAQYGYAGVSWKWTEGANVEVKVFGERFKLTVEPIEERK